MAFLLNCYPLKILSKKFKQTRLEHKKLKKVSFKFSMSLSKALNSRLKLSSKISEKFRKVFFSRKFLVEMIFGRFFEQKIFGVSKNWRRRRESEFLGHLSANDFSRYNEFEKFVRNDVRWTTFKKNTDECEAEQLNPCDKLA